MRRGILKKREEKKYVGKLKNKGRERKRQGREWEDRKEEKQVAQRH